MPAPPRPSRPARTDPDIAKTMGTAKKKSRQEASAASERAVSVQSEIVPCAPDGYPLTMVEAAAAELIPHGQFANISVGPVRIRHYFDPREDGGISDEIKANIAQTANQLFEIAGFDVIGIQRGIVLESLQSQNESDKTK